MIFTGKILNGQEAEKIGLVTFSTTATPSSGTAPSDSTAIDSSCPFEKSVAFAKEMLDSGPVALRMAKRAIDEGIQLDL